MIEGAKVLKKIKLGWIKIKKRKGKVIMYKDLTDETKRKRKNTIIEKVKRKQLKNEKIRSWLWHDNRKLIKS